MRKKPLIYFLTIICCASLIGCSASEIDATETVLTEEREERNTHEIQVTEDNLTVKTTDTTGVAETIEEAEDKSPDDSASRDADLKDGPSKERRPEDNPKKTTKGE